MKYVCPVCGFDRLGEPAYDEVGCSSFDICSCCGTQFGYDDSQTSHAELRQRWISSGALWKGAQAPPEGWRAGKQVDALRSNKSDKSRTGLSTHILDTAMGQPAIGIQLTLAQLQGAVWTDIGSGTTNEDGRCDALLGENRLKAAIYKVKFSITNYFASQKTQSLYPSIEVVFKVTDPAQHHHIPLLLTANGYTTYRGS